MDGYSFASWKAYCEKHVRPQHVHDREQIARLDRLLKPETASAWMKLAGDQARNRDDTGLGPMTWREALHQVIGTLIFPPNMIKKPDTEKDAYILAARKNEQATGWSHLPLIPAERTENAQRNWVALYLRVWVIPVFFNRKHYQEIADLVEQAWGSGDGFSAVQVRLLKPFHFRKSYRKKSG